MEDDYDDDILRYALKGAQQHEKMSGANQRAKDAFFDGLMSKTVHLQTKQVLLKAYGPSFVCQDGGCKICNWYRDGTPVPCRSCHGQARPREPSQTEVCQFHKSHDCLQLAGFDVHGKAPEAFTTPEQRAQMEKTLPTYRSTRDFIVGYHKPVTAKDNDWGVKKCGCLIHVYVWDTCHYCSPVHYKTTNYSVQWRHYIDEERTKKPPNTPVVFNSDYYNRIHHILVEENKQVNKQVEINIDYDDCDHEIFRQACSFCDRLPMPGDEPFKRCAQCHVAKYCSVDCQKWAWSKHRAECKTVAVEGSKEPAAEAIADK